MRVGRVATLLDQAHSAVDGGDPQRAGVGDLAQIGGDLGGELAGRGEDQRGGARPVGGDSIDQRDAEGERLARPGGRAGEHVAPGEDITDDQALNRERAR